MVDFANFDTRHYPTLAVREGYEAWAPTYEATVLDLMDLRLLGRLKGVDWPGVRRAVDLACGTGRGGSWLKAQGVGEIDGVDFTPAMLALARTRGVYGRLLEGDVAAGRPSGRDLRSGDHAAGGRASGRSCPCLSRGRAPDLGGRPLRPGRLPPVVPDVRRPDAFRPRAGRPGRHREPRPPLCRPRPAPPMPRAGGWRSWRRASSTTPGSRPSPKWERHRDRPISFAFVWEKRGPV